MEAPSDRELIERHLKNRDDEESLRLLFDRHLGAIFGFLARFAGPTSETEDLVQETFIKAWKHLGRFRPTGNFRTWLFRIARNTAVDWLRKRRDRPFSDFEDDRGANPLVEGIEDEADLPDEVLARRDAAEVLQSALDKLTPPYREVVTLRHQAELSFQEIGETLKEPLNTVKSRYRRALIMLKKILSRP